MAKVCLRQLVHPARFINKTVTILDGFSVIYRDVIKKTIKNNVMNLCLKNVQSVSTPRIRWALTLTPQLFPKVIHRFWGYVATCIPGSQLAVPDQNHFV